MTAVLQSIHKTSVGASDSREDRAHSVTGVAAPAPRGTDGSAARPVHPRGRHYHCHERKTSGSTWAARLRPRRRDDYRDDYDDYRDDYMVSKVPVDAPWPGYLASRASMVAAGDDDGLGVG